MEWTTPSHSKGAIDRAGKALISPTSTDAERIAALNVVNNWRTAHNFPLNTFQVTLRKRAAAIDPSRLVAQRIKRMSSIEAKLARFSNMRMTQMQDLGGCRSILNSVKNVQQLVQSYKDSAIKHKLDALDDYIVNPKASGYRGVHMIYRYFSDRSGPDIYNGFFVEMQIRTRLQHTWATAVETVGTFLQQALKSSMGEKDWLRFFSLMGSAFAIKERCNAMVPNTPDNPEYLYREIIDLESRLSIRSTLAMYQQAIQVAKDGTKKGEHYYLLTLEPSQGKMTVKGFQRNLLAEASAQYLREEERVATQPGAEAVLVSVDSISSLERAYPNYFLDTTVFLQELDKLISTKYAWIK